MTRDKAINILARLAGGATQPSWEEIRKAAQFACDVLSDSPEDGVHIQFNDDRTLPKPTLQGLDEAALRGAYHAFPETMEALSPQMVMAHRTSFKRGFKARAKWNSPAYNTIKKVLALGFMQFLDEHRPEDKMCLSNGECMDIEKAFDERDWEKLERYLKKYSPR